MDKEALLDFLRILRDAKFALASRGLKYYYDAWRNGCYEESRVIRCGAMKELGELLALERWIASLGGKVDRSAPCPACAALKVKASSRTARELSERCRVLRLVNNRLAGGNGVGERLRAFLVELAAEEAGRINGLLSRRCVASS